MGRWLAFLTTSFGLAVFSSVFACGTCGCSLNCDWVSQGLNFGPGFHLDLRFDYFDQDQLRTGTGRVDTGRITFPTDREIQLRTINRNLTLDLSYSPSADWSFDLVVPTADRTHSTVAEGDLYPSYSRSAGLGDLRLVARYQGLAKDRSFGLFFGLKLPTGRTGDTFSSGPQAGTPVDRGLQLGSGTTDLIAGVYKFGAVSSSWDYFAQLLVDVPLGPSRGFEPGDSLTASGGFRYKGWDAVTPQVQLNLRAEKPETGAEADTANSGATLAYISPGVTVELGSGVQLYAFVQVPLYQRVTGYQLEPREILSFGLHFRF